MTYVVVEACIRCKYMDCAEVCPVPDCFHEGPNMLVINPEVCIDCGVCQPACPIDAIFPDTQTGMEKWVEFNQKYAQKWPAINEKGPAPEDANEWAKISSKMNEFKE